MEVEVCFSKAVHGWKVVEYTEDVIGSLPSVDCFVTYMYMSLKIKVQ